MLLNTVKQRPIISAVVIIALILFSIPLGWKATTKLMSATIYNPESPLFSEEKFNFRNYRSEKEFQEALDAMFHVGMHRTDVEAVLSNDPTLFSGLTEGKDGHYFISYAYPFLELPPNRFFSESGIQQAEFEYDASDRVVAIKSHIINGKRPPRFFLGDVIKMG